jgi:hypothetical protein
MKQETPEEAAERIYPMVGNEYLWHVPIQRREGFIEGAKWQQERSYSEEDMMDYSNYRLLIKKSLSPKEWFEKHNPIKKYYDQMDKEVHFNRGNLNK